MMKRLIIFTLFLGMAAVMNGQRPYFCTSPGAVMDYTIYNADGDENGTSRITIKNVDGAGDNCRVTYVSEVFAGGEAVIKPMEVTTAISGGKVSLSLGSSSLEVDVEGKVPFVPSRMAVGMELDCGTITVNAGGLTVKTDIIENRVVDREEVTTPAGTFKCYVVQQVSLSKVFGMKVQGTTKTWYSRGIGTVKSEAYDAKGNLTQTQLLTGFKK